MFKVIIKRRNGETKALKDGITRKVMVWDSREDAQAFADSCFANARCDYKNQGRRLPTYSVEAA
jgi:hypothetical protein